MQAKVIASTSEEKTLTKSRFKQALECPTKLFYTGKADFANTTRENSFLAALAEGGYQVGALACLMYPDGIEVDAPDHASQVRQTQALLAQEDVTIYEAAFEAQGLFVRVDILRKRGPCIELIEVKAKSIDGSIAAGSNFRNSKGEIASAYLPYLRDIAFQTHVARLAYPSFEFHSFLMLADKSKSATVEGLNQCFPVKRDDNGGRQIKVSVAPGTAQRSGEPILTAINVDGLVQEILGGTLSVLNQAYPFAEAVDLLAKAYRQDQRLGPMPSKACGTCEFKTPHPPLPGEPRSGFHECWKAAFKWEDPDFKDSTVLDLWNFAKKDALISQGVLKLKQLTQEDLGFDGSEVGPEGLSRKHRQWFQASGQWPGGGDYFLDRFGLAASMKSWRYPLHFIDFETCAVAIPFNAGHRPYETVAFQFSHHVMQADGRVSHQSQFLKAEPGFNPNFEFLRALRRALGGDDGTIFRWATHENTVLNHLRLQLMAEQNQPADAQALIDFIESITVRNEDGVDVEGPRAMVDLCKLAERFYFHPATRGSSSLKKVLPALMRSSTFLRELYGAPNYASPSMPSLNLKQGMTWWVQDEDGSIRDPYTLLPPVFADLSPEQLANLDASFGEELKEGGAAMAAYARLQFETLAPRERDAIQNALLRYCELDTLAMVMAVQAWQPR